MVDSGRSELGGPASAFFGSLAKELRELRNMVQGNCKSLEEGDSSRVPEKEEG